MAGKDFVGSLAKQFEQIRSEMRSEQQQILKQMKEMLLQFQQATISYPVEEAAKRSRETGKSEDFGSPAEMKVDLEIQLKNSQNGIDTSGPNFGNSKSQKVEDDLVVEMETSIVDVCQLFDEMPKGIDCYEHQVFSEFSRSDDVLLNCEKVRDLDHHQAYVSDSLPSENLDEEYNLEDASMKLAKEYQNLRDFRIQNESFLLVNALPDIQIGTIFPFQTNFVVLETYLAGIKKPTLASTKQFGEDEIQFDVYFGIDLLLFNPGKLVVIMFAFDPGGMKSMHSPAKCVDWPLGNFADGLFIEDFTDVVRELAYAMLKILKDNVGLVLHLCEMVVVLDLTATSSIWAATYDGFILPRKVLVDACVGMINTMFPFDPGGDSSVVMFVLNEIHQWLCLHLTLLYATVAEDGLNVTWGLLSWDLTQLIWRCDFVHWVQWLSTFGDVVLNLKELGMSFCYQGVTYVLRNPVQFYSKPVHLSKRAI